MRSHRRRRAAVLAAAVGSLAALTAAPAAAATIPTPGDSLVAARAWSSNRASLPSFPRVAGWDLWRSGSSTIRVFKGDGWTRISRIPRPTMSCGDGRWYIQWRSANPDVTVRVSGGDAYPSYRPFIARTGGSGYVSGLSCVEPRLQFGSTRNGNQSNLVDVKVQYRVWTPR